jgi:eukaryotic-like serine/threonine-protein kinase
MRLLQWHGELTRRKVYGVAGAYMAVAVVIATAIAELHGHMGLPGWTPRMVLVLLAAGLPVALVLAWAYELRPEAEAPPADSTRAAATFAVNAGSVVAPPHTAPLHGEVPTADTRALTARLPESAERTPGGNSIVVLPFDNMSPDPSDAYLADGLTEEITADLAGIRALRVISRTSAFRYRGAGKDAGTIAQELNVGYVLEGSVRKLGDRLRITCQLIDAATDSHLWAHRHDGTMEDVFDLQERVARSVAESLELKLTPAEETSLAVRPLPDPAAYQCYLRARNAVWTGTAEALEQALRHLEHAASIAGENALLHAATAYVHLQQANFGYAQDAAIEAAERHARAALELEPECVEALVVLGAAAQAFRGRLDESIRLLTRARALQPGDLDAAAWLVNACQLVGRNAEALELARMLVAVDPLSPISHVMHSHVLHRAGQFTPSCDAARTARRLAPDLPLTLFVLAKSLAYAGHVAELANFLEHEASDVSFLSRFAHILGASISGDEARVRELMDDEFQATCRRDPDFALFVADAFAALGAVDDALEWLDNAVERGFANYPYLAQHDPFMARLRDEPRFVGILERCRMEWKRFKCVIS